MEERLLDRFKEYDSSKCWQRYIRESNLAQDIEESGLSLEEISSLTPSDFTFSVCTDTVPLIAFIKRHEWLGTIAQYTTHWFASYYKDILAGVILMGIPVTFSKLLGDDTRKIERLINRGACISWSPINLGSFMIMKSIRWMVQNTRYRLFTAYSDPHAGELGTIYQACNFYYLGQKAGAQKRYINPYTRELVSDRYFRCKSAYKRYAKELGIEWQKDWLVGVSVNWDAIPYDVEIKLREMSKEKQRNADYVNFTKKHKYAYVLGASKKETKFLRQEFEKRNKIYSYPKERGLLISGVYM